MGDQSTAAGEHAQTRAVVAILRDADACRHMWAPLDTRELHYHVDYTRLSRKIAGLHLPADDEANALARLREVLGITE